MKRVRHTHPLRRNNMGFLPDTKPKITAWSYSRLKAWETCPKQAYFKFIMKLKEPDSVYAARGTELHEMAEKYTKGELADAPPPLQGTIQWIDEFRHPDSLPEQQLSFDRGWKKVDWFSFKTYCRVIFDAFLVQGPIAKVADYKSGKVYKEDHMDQMRLYALAAFKLNPEVEKVEAQVIYFDQDQRMKLEFTRDKEAKLQTYWEDRANKMLSDDIFPATPNPKCKWCHFRKSNGGPCSFA